MGGAVTGDLIISARKGGGAVHPLNVQWRRGRPLFRGFPKSACERELLPLSSSDALMPSSACCTLRNLASFITLARFFAMYPLTRISRKAMQFPGGRRLYPALISEICRARQQSPAGVRCIDRNAPVTTT